MSNSHDNDDWSNDSASLFREARRAHDPTLAESTRLAAVLTRIQTAKAEAAFAANRGADIVARGATSAMLRRVAGVSLGVVCIAAASFVFIHVNNQRSEPARNAKPAPIPVVNTPPAIEAAARSGGATSTGDEALSRPRSQARRSRAATERQRTSRLEVASVNSTSVTAPPENSAPRQERPEPRGAARAVAVTQNAQQETVTVAARKADPTLPEQATTELTIMKRIQRALLDADFSTVLALCVEHARRWPHGVFELEREGVRAIASCGGNSDDAALRAKRFLTAHPRAPVAMRVSAACAAQLSQR